MQFASNGFAGAFLGLCWGPWFVGFGEDEARSVCSIVLESAGWIGAAIEKGIY